MNTTVMGKAILLVFVILAVSSVASAQTAKAGVDQSIKVSVERADHGIVDRTKAHCLQNNLDFCSQNTSLFDTVIVMFNLEGLFESDSNEQVSQSPDKVQVIG